MTNHWVDIKNADCVLIMGANPADNHPVSFKWISQAKAKGATIISVDPRFTRTSAQAHIYAPLRAGTDIAFLGGMIHYILSKELYFKPYLAAYTNASFKLGPDYDFSEGLFAGFDPQARRYDKAAWAFQRNPKGKPRRDLTLHHPACVFQHLKRHYARYTLETVSQVTGTPPEALEQVYQAFAATGARDKAGTILYAMGWTQHTVGVQNIRMSIISDVASKSSSVSCTRRRVFGSMVVSRSCGGFISPRPLNRVTCGLPRRFSAISRSRMPSRSASSRGVVRSSLPRSMRYSGGIATWT